MGSLNSATGGTKHRGKVLDVAVLHSERLLGPVAPPTRKKEPVAGDAILITQWYLLSFRS